MLTKYFCSVCHEDFGDEIMGLMCGHMFHRACLQDWQRRSGTCPECRRLIFNTPIRIHIQSREIDERTLPIVVELTGKLEENVLIVSESEHKLRQADEIHLQWSQQEKKLEDIEEENNYLKTVEQSLRGELDLRNTEISKLNEAMESFRRELDLKNIEISKLNEDLRKTMESTHTKSEVTNSERHKHLMELADRDKQIYYLEKELRAKSLELERELRNSSMLIYEKMNLQRSLDMKSNRSQHDRFADGGNTYNAGLSRERENNPTVTVPNISDKNINSNGQTKTKKLSKEQYELFKSAKALYKCGYHSVFFKENVIYALKSKGSTPLKIENKKHLESLIALSAEANSSGSLTEL